MGSCLSRCAGRINHDPVELSSSVTVGPDANHCVRTNPAPSLQDILYHLDELRYEWFNIGLVLGIKIAKLKEIEQEYNGHRRCLSEMVYYWLNSNPAACWEQLIRAQEQLDQFTPAATIKRYHLWEEPSARVMAGSVPATPTSDADTAEIEADVKVVRQLRDLEFALSEKLYKIKQLRFEDNDIPQAVFALNDFTSTDDFTSCTTIEQIILTMRRGYIDTFSIYLLEKVAECLKSEEMKRLVKEYEELKQSFLEETTVLDFQKAVVSRAKPPLPKGKVEVSIVVQNRSVGDRVLKDMELLASEVFEGHQRRFVSFHAIQGSIILVWYVPETLCDELEELIHQKTDILRENGVEELSLGEERVFLQKDRDQQEAAIPGSKRKSANKIVQEQAAVIAEQEIKLRGLEDDLKAANKRIKENALQRRRDVLAIWQLRSDNSVSQTGASLSSCSTVDLVVNIEDESFNLLVIPDSSSALVKGHENLILTSVDLDSLVTDLSMVGKLTRIAYIGGAAYDYTYLQMNIRSVVVTMSELCEKSIITVGKFLQTSKAILVDLQTTYQFLIDGIEDIDVVIFNSTGTIVHEMAKEAGNLAMAFDKEAKQVEEVLEVTKSGENTALHMVKGALIQLSSILRKISHFWFKLEICHEFGNEQIVKLIKTAMEKPKAYRFKVWGTSVFKTMAIRYYAQWVALGNICGQYVERIKVTQSELYDQLKENLTSDEARKSLIGLAASFAKELEVAQKAVED